MYICVYYMYIYIYIYIGKKGSACTCVLVREFTKGGLAKGVEQFVMFSICTLKTEPNVLQLHKGNA